MRFQGGGYWTVYTLVGELNATGLLDSGLESAGARNLGYHSQETSSSKRSEIKRKRQMRLARNILSAVAFEMMCGVDGTGTQIPLDKVKETIGSFCCLLYTSPSPRD